MSRKTELFRAIGFVGLMALGGLLVLPMSGCASREVTLENKATDSVQREEAAQEKDAGQLKEPSAPTLDIPNARYPQPGLLTGGQPSREQLVEAAEAGYRTIINLRSLRETAGGDEAAEVEKLGLRYIAIPISGSEDLTGENAELLAAALADEANYPVMLHCASGNRVGGLLALKAAYVDGKDAEEALAAGLEAGLKSLEPKVRQILGLRTEVEE